MKFQLLVRGDRACFRRPEFAADLVSYDVITPLAACALFDAIHAGPALRWRIDELRVLAPIRTTWMALAEIECGAGVAAIVGGRRDRRMAHVLCDVAYVVAAHAEPALGDDECHALRDRVASGGLARPLCLGHRSFAAEVALIEPGEPLPASAWATSGAVDLGWMLYDVTQASTGPRFFRPTMVGGVIDLRRPESLILAG